MTRRWKRIGLALLLLAGGLLAARLYALYVSGPDSVLRRAEAFAFRRMTVAQLDEEGRYRFHYVTNREPGGGADLDERFGADRTETLAFGAFETRIEPTLGIGMLIDPTAWFQNEMIQIDEVTELEREAFLGRMREMVAASPDRSLLIVVHGFREAFPSALRKTAFLGHVLDINAPVLLFDWPGNQGSSLRGYRRARAVAEASGAELADTLRLVIREIGPERLWLLANSLGAQVVADAFAVLHADPELADADAEIEQVLLTAPDVDHDEFDARFQQEITALTKRLTVYVSSNDRALLVSRLVNRGRRRGESSVGPDQLEEAERIADLMSLGDDRITLVDVTPVNRTRNFHNFSLETPEFFDDLYLRLSDRRVPRSRLLYPLRTAEGQVYWVLTRGR